MRSLSVLVVGHRRAFLLQGRISLEGTGCGDVA